MKAVVAAFNQEKALVGAFSVIKNLRMELFQALLSSVQPSPFHFSRQLNLTSAATSSIVFSSVALLLLTCETEQILIDYFRDIFAYFWPFSVHGVLT